MFEPKSLTNR